MKISDVADIIVAACTIVLTYLTYRNVKLTHDILKAGEDASKEESRPYIIANVYSENLFIKLSIENIGKRPAKNLQAEFYPSLDHISSKTKNGDLNFDTQSILNQAFIPPDFKTVTTLNFNQEYFKLEEIPDF